MSSEPGWPGDTTFARRLLDSASGDAQPREARKAWARFAGRLSALAPDPRGDVGGPPASVAVSGAAAVARAPWFTAVKWLVLGAIGGGGLTAGLLVERRPAVVERAAAPHAPPAGASRDNLPPAPEATPERRSGHAEEDAPRAVGRHVPAASASAAASVSASRAASASGRAPRSRLPTPTRRCD